MPDTESKKQNSFIALGVMSGTSVDGLDLALCRFERICSDKPDSGIDKNPVDQGSGNRDNDPGNRDYENEYGLRNDDNNSPWNFEILKTRSISYSGTAWPERLAAAETADGFTLMGLHRDFGRFTGEAIKEFLVYPDPTPDLIASHGHTIFHRPEKGITLQIGDGAEIAAVTGITTVSDFRRLDVALGGQGAPLVPAGDDLLFGSYDYCLNLGGFANISFRESGKRVAFDICPVNIVLDRLAQSMGLEYDKGGQTAFSGKVIHGLLEQLENLDFYSLDGPRSLGREWVEEVFKPFLDKFTAPVEDKMRTVCEHIALRIAAVIARPRLTTDSSLFATGGGAKNGFLMELIAEKASPVRVIIPEEELIDFKEAVVFAFLGILRLRNEINCLASVTGAGRDSSGGIIHIA